MDSAGDFLLHKEPLCPLYLQTLLRHYRLVDNGCMMLRLNEANKAVADTREKIERQNEQLSNYEAEIKLLRRRSDSWDSDREKDKRQIDMLQAAVNRARTVSNTSTASLLHHFPTSPFRRVIVASFNFFLPPRSEGGIVFSSVRLYVCFPVCLFVCQHNNS